MSMIAAEEISVQAMQADIFTDGKRTVDGVKIELGDSIQRRELTGVERSDWFKGIECTLTFQQAKHLHDLLGRSIAYVEELHKTGRVHIK